MSSVFNAADNNMPFFGSRVRPQAELRFSAAHSEGHVSGRHLNAGRTTTCASYPTTSPAWWRN